jgi:hypothetical protein
MDMGRMDLHTAAHDRAAYQWPGRDPAIEYF